jgi:hypothetical protein
LISTTINTVSLCIQRTQRLHVSDPRNNGSVSL